MAAWREVARMGTSREVAHMAASRDLIRSRHQQVVAARRQPSGATQSRAQAETRVATIPTNTQVTAGRNLVIELPH